MAGLMRRLAGESQQFGIGGIVELGRSGYTAGRALGTVAPDVMLREMTDLTRDLPQAVGLHQQYPDIPLVGVTSRDLQVVLDRGAGSDVSALAVWPFTIAQLEQAISVGMHKVHAAVHENLNAV